MFFAITNSWFNSVTLKEWILIRITMKYEFKVKQVFLFCISHGNSFQQKQQKENDGRWETLPELVLQGIIFAFFENIS
ncbi:hypothetical protein CNR22_11335 [Sphingobacteriaceae bacterium]|nr:hypothetical protein CNR22_11335 [Sphingobacteriaceae bacterium]